MTRSTTGTRTTRAESWAQALPAVFLWHLVLALWLGLTAPAQAADAPDAVDALAPPSQPLGQYMRLLTETDTPLDLTAARQAFATAQHPPIHSSVLGLGIGHRPVWAHLVVDNPTDQPLKRQLAVSPSWTDALDVHVVHPAGDTTRWHTGDALTSAPYLDDALGYLFEHSFPPGRSEVLIRFATPDPMIVNVQLLTPLTLAQQAKFEHSSYGVLYGFLAALSILNLIMYFGLGRGNSLYYALYLLSFVAMNLSYTGRGMAWLWPEAPYFQRYVILVLMVLSATAGLKFAREFLALDQSVPALGRGIQWACRGIIAWILVTVLFNWHATAVYTAFLASGIFSVALVPIGILAQRRGQAAAGYFLASGIASAIGLCATTFSVWGLLPFTPWTYRGVEMGTMAEALLLQLALVQFIRAQMLKRLDAERDARVDALTQLANRRGFLEQAETAYGLAVRHQRPLAAVILDIDLFKAINDGHGHAIGDAVLVKVGQTLTRLTRNGDCVARWGGEEFIMLLPETDLTTATQFAERIRCALEEMVVIAKDEVRVQITASFGVAQLKPDQSLEKLITAADDALYSVKQSGRNRVAHAD
jgi:diguanylate cyclase (GGDEF)-like protein